MIERAVSPSVRKATSCRACPSARPGTPSRTCHSVPAGRWGRTRGRGQGQAAMQAGAGRDRLSRTIRCKCGHCESRAMLSRLLLPHARDGARLTPRSIPRRAERGDALGGPAVGTAALGTVGLALVRLVLRHGARRRLDIARGCGARASRASVRIVDARPRLPASETRPRFAHRGVRPCRAACCRRKSPLACVRRGRSGWRAACIAASARGPTPRRPSTRPSASA